MADNIRRTCWEGYSGSSGKDRVGGRQEEVQRRMVGNSDGTVCLDTHSVGDSPISSLVCRAQAVFLLP